MTIKPGMSWNDLRKDENSFFDPSHLNRDSVQLKDNKVTSGHAKIHLADLKTHLNHGSVSFLTAHNPNDKPLSPYQNQLRNSQLESDLTRMGAVYHKLKGKYNREEDSFMVHHSSKVKPEDIEHLGRKYGQKAVLHTSRGKHQMKYVTGPNEGKHHPGEGVEFNSQATNFYSQIPNKHESKFSAQVDFNTLKRSEAAKEKKFGYIIETEDSGMHEFDLPIDQNTLKP